MLHKCHIPLLGDHAAFALDMACLIPLSARARTKSAPCSGVPIACQSAASKILALKAVAGIARRNGQYN